jgi:hypothetical protein
VNRSIESIVTVRGAQYAGALRTSATLAPSIALTTTRPLRSAQNVVPAGTT